jgi:putative DNA primase/helicase
MNPLPQAAAARALAGAPTRLALPDTVPAELAVLPQWVAWRWEERDSKPTKPPLNPHTGEYASTTDPATWGTLQDALRFRRKNPSAAGVGFVFTKNDPHAGVDLDKCRNPETGEIAPWAKSIVGYLRSYAEVSPSHTGVKVFVRAALPAGAKKGAIEAYDFGRYFTVTGDHVADTPPTIEDRHAELQALYAWLKADEAANRQVALPPTPVGLDDAALIEKARTAANGAKFERLWNGDWSDYPSQSEADLALCSQLAFWTGGERDRIDRLFRQSGLYRRKWDEPHFADGRAYGTATIDTAISRAGAFYGNGFGRPSPPPSNGHGPPPTPVRFPRTDSGNAELFARLYGERLRYDHRRNRWLLWTHHWWKPDVDEEVLRLAKEAVRRRYQVAPDLFDDPDEFRAEAKWAVASESRMRLEAALALAQAERPIADSGEGWDANPWLLAVANGVVDLRTGALRDGRPDDRITMHSSVPYIPEATCHRWLAFLREVFGDDDELIDFIWRACAYSLTGLTNEECHFFCFGSGCNGKGTFNRVQRDILGDYAANTAFSTLEMSSRNGIPNDLAALYGKRLVTASELNEAVRLNEARMKMLAGQDPVTARFLHGEYFTFVPNAKFWLAVNHKPMVNDDSTGFWRKIRLIPFTQCFEGRADRNLKDALTAEYPGILAWMVDGCLEWQRRGLEPPPSVRAATEQYRAESDPVADFLRDRCATDPEFTARAGELYLAYQSWALKQGLKEREQLTATRFGRLMGQRFPKDSDRDGTFYQGVTPRPPEASGAR